MSRIGKKPISIPAGVEASMSANVITVKGPKGTLNFAFRREVAVVLTDNEIAVEKKGSTKLAQALWGTTAKMMTNMCEGVTNGFQKQVELNGVGYRMAIAGNKVTLALGFSHPVEVTVPSGLEVTIEGNIMTVKGIDKQSVGQFAAIVRKLKPVEPYKGKGFRYVGEVVRRKEGKKAS